MPLSATLCLRCATHAGAVYVGAVIVLAWAWGAWLITSEIIPPRKPKP